MPSVGRLGVCLILELTHLIQPYGIVGQGCSLGILLDVGLGLWREVTLGERCYCAVSEASPGEGFYRKQGGEKYRQDSAFAIHIYYFIYV